MLGGWAERDRSCRGDRGQSSEGAGVARSRFTPPRPGGSAELEAIPRAEGSGEDWVSEVCTTVFH